MQDICVHFWAFLRMWRHTFPDYQLISRQIKNQLARAHKAIGSHLNNERTVNAILYYFNCSCNKNDQKPGYNCIFIA